MNPHRLLFLFALLAAVCLGGLLTPRPVSAQDVPEADVPTPVDEIPTDPDVRIGQLENGLVYYIRHNEEPEDRAQLRLVVDAGSILEEEDQLGLAHFTEHMLFNGTRRFPENELVDFLEHTGMRFGPDINAYTSFDETVYMLPVPTDSAALVETAFDVLEDWAAYATLSDEEIDKERGVVVEEWRSRQQTPQGRIQEQIFPFLLKDSRYAERLPIGDPDLIQEADYETVRRFYRDWYRPDLMAVVAVGDFDVDRIETLIREHFSGLEVPDAPRPRPTFEIPGHEETRTLVATDPEYPYSGFTVYYRQPAETAETVADFVRERFVSSLFDRMLNDRLAEIARSPEAPFLGAQAFRGGFARPAELYGLGAQVEDGRVLEGLEAVLTEAMRVRAHGFTATELERHKQELLRSYERAYQERANINSSALADAYAAHFLEEEPIPSVVQEYALAQRYLPQVDLAEVNALAADLLAEANRTVIVTMPEKEGLSVPTEAELTDVLEHVEEKQVEAYVDAVGGDALIEQEPAPGAVARTRQVEEIGVTEVVLENGIRLVMKPTDFKEDEVRFTAFSPGGSSLVDEEEIFEASMATSLVTQSGVGAFDRTQLEKLLAGKVVGVSPYLDELEEGFRGSASPEDLQELFQLLHLYFTAPRADEGALGALQNRMRAMLVNRAANPQAVFMDSLQQALYGDHPRRNIPTVAQVDSLDLEEAYRIYQERFADAGDFTFVFVGNFDVDRLTELAQTYLGSLPDLPGQETWRDVAPDLPKGVVTTTVRKGVGDKSQVVLRFHGPFDYDRESRYQIRSLEDVLGIMLREELREELGGVYGVNVNASYDDEPDPTYAVTVSFSAAPERADELMEAVYREIERLQAEGPDPATVEKVKEQQRRARETALETNAFWLGNLAFYYGQETEDLLDILDYEEMIDTLTAADVQEAARTHLDADHHLKAVLLPEER